MTPTPQVIALSCGEPAGIGPEIAVAAWDQLRADCPFVWIGDPRHLPESTQWQQVNAPVDARDVCATALPGLWRHRLQMRAE